MPPDPRSASRTGANAYGGVRTGTAPRRVRDAGSPARPTVQGAHPLATPGTYTRPTSPGWYLKLVKPAFDLAAALVLIVVLSPVLLVGMIAVRVTLGPGVFYAQNRVGLDGRTFRTYKLRTMAHDRRAGSDDLEAFSEGRWDGVERRQTHKSPYDPRMSPVGRVLRTFSVDEIPQLFNVLKGDMSLVGPRPEIPAVVERHYQPWMHRRHTVKPGLTGLWQISERGNGMMHEHVDVDLDYVDSIGLWTDIKIILATPYAALGPRRGF